MSHWPLSLWVNFIILQVELTRLYVFVMYNFVIWMSILVYVFVWVFVMHMCANDYPYYSCIGFRHAHFCMNDSPYSYEFSSCTSLYEWLFIFFFYGFSSCTFLDEWLSIFLWVFVMHIFVRMTIHILMGFRHAHLCTNDYPFSYERLD